MSHISHLGGAYNAAAEYQAFLEQLKSARQTEREEQVRARTKIEEPEEEGAEDRPDERESEAEAEPAPDPGVDADDPPRKTYA